MKKLSGSSVLKKPKCKSCKKEFVRFNTTQQACSVDCALDLVQQKKQKAYNAETRRMKSERNESDRRWCEKRAEKSCNHYIRVRDFGRPCISCGVQYGQVHAGHWKSVGACPELRYHEDNINGQCAQCNGPKSGNVLEYRIGLEHRIGSLSVVNLEQNRSPQNLTLEDLYDIHIWYTMKRQLLEGKRLSPAVKKWLAQ